MFPMLLNDNHLTDEKKQLLISVSGIDFGDKKTWTKGNCDRFRSMFPLYEVGFEDLQTYAGGSSNKDNIMFYLKGVYDERVPAHNNCGYSVLKAIAKGTRFASPEQPINLRRYNGLFSECNAKVIVVRNWDLSNAWDVRELFCDNKFVEQIDMRDWKYPENDDERDISFSKMFAGCENLKRLLVKIPNKDNYRHLNPKVLKMFFTDCFKDCKNIEFVYLCKGSEYVLNCIGMIKQVSKKDVTIDGVFKYGDWLELHGGYEIEPVDTSNNSSNIKYHIVGKKPGMGGIKFCGACIAEDITEKKLEVVRLYKNKEISDDDYNKYYSYLDSIKSV